MPEKKIFAKVLKRYCIKNAATMQDSIQKNQSPPSKSSLIGSGEDMTCFASFPQVDLFLEKRRQSVKVQ